VKVIIPVRGRTPHDDVRNERLLLLAVSLEMISILWGPN
jgi:hypothetical protein